MIRRTAAVVSLAATFALIGWSAARVSRSATFPGPTESVSPTDLPRLAAIANGDDAAAAATAIADLRSAGPAGLAALMAGDADAIRAHRARGGVADGSAWDRTAAALDAVAGQKDAYAAGLYWYTSLPDAEAAARAAGRPILSLRLLGKLSDEYSCANSRFFRSILYADPAVSALLRDHFVLHWQSVRPAPVITIDYGDGRVVRRTITGNSIHYVLAADGRVVDGLPGLVGPRAFMADLRQAADAANRLATVPEPDRPAFLADWHAGRVREISAAEAADLGRLGLPASATMTEAVWDALARLHAGDAELSPASTALMSLKRFGGPPAAVAGRLAFSKVAVENPLLKMVGAFRRTLAQDTVHNEYDLHRRLHAMLAEPATSAALSADVAGVNRRVYAELFLTPESDPWLGLGPGDAYTALPDNGVATAAR